MRASEASELVADVAQVDADVGLAAQHLAQLRDRKAVARMDADDRRAVRKELVDLGFQFLRQVFELRLQARAQALSRPDQFFAEWGQCVPRPWRRSTRGAPKNADHFSIRFHACR